MAHKLPRLLLFTAVQYDVLNIPLIALWFLFAALCVCFWLWVFAGCSVGVVCFSSEYQWNDII